MTLSTTPPTPSTSTSGRPSRIPVRRKQPDPLTAVQTTTEQVASLPDGQVVAVPAGLWLISRGSQVIQTLTDHAFKQAYEPVEEGLFLRAATRSQLERRLGFGCTKTAEDLLRAVDRLATIQVGEITLTFTPGQLEELAHRAKKRNVPLAEYLARLLERFTEDLWTITPAAE